MLEPTQQVLRMTKNCHFVVVVVVVVVVFYSSNKSTKTQANETFHYTILVN